MEIKQGTIFRVPVKLVDSNGDPVTGTAFSNVTCYLQKQAGASAQKTVVEADWLQLDATNFPGHYDLVLSAANTDTVGFLKYSIAVSGADRFVGVVEIVANVEADTFARLGAPVGASTSADIAAATAIALISRKVATNRSKVDSAAKTLTLYDDDGTTPLYVFNLKDSAGVATATAIYERVAAA